MGQPAHTTIWLVGGIIIFILGLIGIYLSKMFTEIKNRPFSIIREVYQKAIRYLTGIHQRTITIPFPMLKK